MVEQSIQQIKEVAMILISVSLLESIGIFVCEEIVSGIIFSLILSVGFLFLYYNLIYFSSSLQNFGEHYYSFKSGY